MRLLRQLVRKADADHSAHGQARKSCARSLFVAVLIILSFAPIELPASEPITLVTPEDTILIEQASRGQAVCNKTYDCFSPYGQAVN